MLVTISTNTDELIHDIRNYDASEYDERYENFRKKYNCWDDGNASAKVVETIEELLKA